MVRASLLSVVVVLAATEAWAAPGPGQRALSETELISGVGLTLAMAEAPVTVPSRDEALALDDEMRRFVSGIAGLRNPKQKLAALLEAMVGRGLFSLDYAETTRTARATFHDRQGNCLSFTMLFVGLARAAGLTVSYQTVDVLPTWSNDGQVVMAKHVNAVVSTGHGGQTVVDFNIRDYRGREHQRRVSDVYALGLFYTNLGAEALLRQDYGASLAFLREAARVYPDLPGVWVNLGVLYGRHGLYDYAEASYLRALEADSSEQSALANLAAVYRALGEPELAEVYDRRVQSYRERNPYYHYASAAKAYEQEQFSDALASLRKALRLKQDQHEFHTLRGEVLTALGRQRGAAESFKQARTFESAELQRRQALVRLDGFADR